MADLKHHKLFIHDYINSREISETYTSETTVNGQLFIMLELPKSRSDQQIVVDEIINELATYFDSYADKNPEKLLEEILRKANQLLPEINASLKIKNWLNSLDLLIAIIENNSIHLANIGNIEALLIHKNQLSPILEKNNDLNIKNLFSDITSGELEEGDALIVSTKSLFDYISKDKVKNIVNDYTPSASAIKINELLVSVPDHVTFNTLILKNPSFKDREVPTERQIIVNFEDEEDFDDDMVEVKTENAKENNNQKGKIEQEKPIKIKKKISFDPTALKNIKFIALISNFFAAIGLYFAIIFKIFTKTFSKIKNSIKFIFSKKYRKTEEDKTLNKIEDATNEKYNWWKNLHLKKKIAIIAVLLVSLVLVQSLTLLSQEKAIIEKDTAYEDTLALIDQKINEVDTDLIYKDEEEAETTLMDINNIIIQATKDFPENKDEILLLQERVEHQLNTIRRIHEVPSPLELFDLSASLENSQGIVQKDGIFYILSDNSLFELKDESVEEIYNFGGDQLVLSMTDWPNTEKIVLNTENTDGSKNYTVFDLNSKNTIGTLNQTEQNTTVTDMAIYNNNLYVLDSEQKQIFKYAESGNKFSGGVNWLNSNISAEDASSLSIDGNIYTINNSGKITRYLKGAPENFEHYTPKPPIGQGATIKTFRDSNYLYVIDPSNKKVIIFNKDGNIKDQYTSKKFDDLTDLTIDPEEKAIYLLNNNHLYLLAINE